MFVIRKIDVFNKKVEIINFMKTIDIEELNKMSIIEVRDKFLREKYAGTWCPQGEYLDK